MTKAREKNFNCKSITFRPFRIYEYSKKQTELYIIDTDSCIICFSSRLQVLGWHKQFVELKSINKYFKTYKLCQFMSPMHILLFLTLPQRQSMVALTHLLILSLASVEFYNFVLEFLAWLFNFLLFLSVVLLELVKLGMKLWEWRQKCE